MPRPARRRRVCREPVYSSFIPEGNAGQGAIVLTTDEYEVIRLVDYERMTHEQCAAHMDVSRTTVTEIYDSARSKLADSLVNGLPLKIGGGNYRLCDGSAVETCGRECEKAASFAALIQKGENIMRIAVTYENGEIFQHFGHTAQFKLYNVENGAVVSEQVVATNGSGHGALAGFLRLLRVDTLICGGIGGGAQMALADAGIQLYGGVKGEADAAVQALLAGKLDFNPDVHCDHHDHEHGEGHVCGDHGCGGHGHGEGHSCGGGCGGGCH